MKQFFGVVILGALLVGCSGQGHYSNEVDSEAIEERVVVQGSRIARDSFESTSPVQVLTSEVSADSGLFDADQIITSPAPGNDPIPNEGGAAQFIAYSYSLGLEFPQAGVEPTLQAHVAACEAPWPKVYFARLKHAPRMCIVTNSNVNNRSDDYTNAYLSLRAVPSWIETFQSGLDAEVEAANGEITARNKQSVDLTRQILDTDARLNAKITLKGRLEDLLATREGDLGELLQVERELARVTGEIESITSNLKALRLRVSMSDMTINYSTKRSLVSGGRSNPLGEAFGDFFYDMSSALAAVITFFAVGLPWMIVIAIFLFIWLRGIWPRIRKPKAPKAAKAVETPET